MIWFNRSKQPILTIQFVLISSTNPTTTSSHYHIRDGLIYCGTQVYIPMYRDETKSKLNRGST